MNTFKGHAHWVNTMALSTDYVMKTGAFEPAEAQQLLYQDFREGKSSKKTHKKKQKKQCTLRQINGK